MSHRPPEWTPAVISRSVRQLRLFDGEDDLLRDWDGDFPAGEFEAGDFGIEAAFAFFGSSVGVLVDVEGESSFVDAGDGSFETFGGVDGGEGEGAVGLDLSVGSDGGVGFGSEFDHVADEGFEVAVFGDEFTVDGEGLGSGGGAAGDAEGGEESEAGESQSSAGEWCRHGVVLA